MKQLFNLIYNNVTASRKLRVRTLNRLNDTFVTYRVIYNFSLNVLRHFSYIFYKLNAHDYIGGHKEISLFLQFFHIENLCADNH